MRYIGDLGDLHAWCPKSYFYYPIEYPHRPGADPKSGKWVHMCKGEGLGFALLILSQKFLNVP